MLKHYEIEHPIQILAENLFNEDENSGVLFLKHDVISAMFEVQQEKS